MPSEQADHESSSSLARQAAQLTQQLPLSVQLGEKHAHLCERLAGNAGCSAVLVAAPLRTVTPHLPKL